MPENTFLYYVKTPNNGGKLELETGDMFSPLQNRLVIFPANLRHKVQPYAGNRVSIGIIWWNELPSIYGEVSKEETNVFDKVWEIEDRRANENGKNI